MQPSNDSEKRQNGAVRAAFMLAIVGIVVVVLVASNGYSSERGWLVSTRFDMEDSNAQANLMQVKYDIAYGKVADLNMLKTSPFVVRLVGRSKGNGFCTGSIVGAKYVLTAKHCLARLAPNQVWFVSGIYKVGVNTYRQFRMGKRYIKHPVADIGLVELERPFTLGTYVNKVALGARRPEVGALVRVFGWGGTQQLNGVSKELKYAGMKIVPNTACSNSNILARQLCAEDYNGNVCPGDSGGPMVRLAVWRRFGRIVKKEWRVVATVQGGAGLGCADRSSPDKFEVVATYRSWILSNI